MDIRGTVAIVTGSGAGLGRELAVGFAMAGASAVVVADLDPAAASETAELVEARGAAVVAVVADVRDNADAARIISVAEAVGGPHVLVNNAGGWTPGEQFPIAPAAAWSATLDLNLRAPMLLAQLAIAPMRRVGGGAIVNIASSGGIGEAGYGSPEYGAAKAGIIRFTSSVRDLERSDGVRVMCVAPDWIGLERAVAEWNDLPLGQRAGMPPLIPPADVVEVVLDLVTGGSGGDVVELRGGRPPHRRPGPAATG
jgi:NAD(P)-dependent dehydrogenase (short-subunit alcohol dehydrogenase family)